MTSAMGAAPRGVATDDDPAHRAAPAGRRSRLEQAGIVALVALAAGPIVVAAASVMGQSWFPVGDWASLVFRTSQVGTADTPLIGAYSTKGGAHPGPLHYWLGAPLYRLMGGDPRGLPLTAAAINVACVVALAALAWRRGRGALLLVVTALAAVAVHGFAAERMVDLWNPYPPLLPFLVGALLVWMAALGDRRAGVAAVVPLSFAAQCHLAFVPLVLVVVAWGFAWARWAPRALAAGDDDAGDASAGDDDAGDAVGGGWRPVVVRAALLAGLLWLGPVVDAVFLQRNPLRVLEGFGRGETPRLGLGDAVGLVGRHVRPDGPWMGGPEPTSGFAVVGSGALPLVVALVVLAGCVVVARRRRLADAAALATLALLLVVVSVPAAAQLVRPVERYVVQWLKLMGTVTWLAVAWTLWRLVEPAVRAAPARRAAGVALAGAVVVASFAGSWGDASGYEPQLRDEGELVRALGPRLGAALDEYPDGDVVRVERRGEPWHVFGPSVTYWLLDNGYDIVTGDGAGGLKWGRSHRWDAGDPYDRLLTIAVHDAGSYTDAFAECERFPGARLIASYDALGAEDRAWLDDLRLRRLEGPEAVSDADDARASALERQDLRIGVFEADEVCAEDRVLDPG